MTYFPDIHTRAADLVRESRGRLNLREAYQELARRATTSRRLRGQQVAMQAANEAVAATRGTSRQVYAWQQRADLA